MVNNKSITGPVLTGGSSSNPSGNAGSGSPAAAGSTPGNIPAVPKAKQGLRTEVTALVAGLGSQLPGNVTLAVNGQPSTASSLLAAFQAALALYAAVDQAVQALKTQRLALKSALPGVRALYASTKAALVANFGKGNPVLEAFGFSIQKPRPLTVEQKLARKEKAKATRELRGTAGKRAKQSVKYQGQVQVQATLSSATPTAGGNAVPAGSTTASASSPAGVKNAAGSGNTGTSGS